MFCCVFKIVEDIVVGCGYFLSFVMGGWGVWGGVWVVEKLIIDLVDYSGFFC